MTGCTNDILHYLYLFVNCTNDRLHNFFSCTSDILHSCQFTDLNFARDQVLDLAKLTKFGLIASIFIVSAIKGSFLQNPCSNRPVRCVICDGTYCSYNIQNHYEASHLIIPIPTYISEEEKVAVLKMFS
jgi:hypothetical protein